MVHKSETYSAGAQKEDYDMPSGYEGLHGMIECPDCGCFAQVKPGMDMQTCNNCNSHISL